MLMHPLGLTSASDVLRLFGVFGVPLPMRRRMLIDAAGPELVTAVNCCCWRWGHGAWSSMPFSRGLCTDAAVPFSVFRFQPPFSTFFFPHVAFSTVQEAFDAQSFVSRLLGFGDMKGLMKQIQESQEGAGDPKEMMYVFQIVVVVQSKQQHQCRSRTDQQQH